MAENQRRSLEDLNNIYIASQYPTVAGGRGLQVPLVQISKQVFQIGSSELKRYDRKKGMELTVVPVFYTLLDDWKNYIYRKEKVESEQLTRTDPFKDLG